MFGPGAYRPDPTEGITAIADLPPPEIVPYSRNDKRQPCPRCSHSAYRDKQFQRTLHDLGNLDLWCPRDLVVTYTYCIPSSDSAHVLSYQWFPTSNQCGEAMARRRKEERRAGIASQGIVRLWGRFSSRVCHRAVPDRNRVPDQCHASGSAVDVCSDAPAWAQRAECAADGGIAYISRALLVSPRALRIHAQRVARFAPYNTRNCLPPKTLRREIQ